MIRRVPELAKLYPQSELSIRIGPRDLALGTVPEPELDALVSIDSQQPIWIVAPGSVDQGPVVTTIFHLFLRTMGHGEEVQDKRLRFYERSRVIRGLVIQGNNAIHLTGEILEEPR